MRLRSSTVLLVYCTVWVALLLPAPGVRAQTRQAVTYHDAARRQIREKYTVSLTRPPRRHGSYQGYYTNGTARAKGAYTHGLPSGDWVYYYENGRRKMQGRRQGGRKHGHWDFFYENGNRQMSGTLQADTRTGSWTYYYESGKLKSEGAFNKDRKEGTWRYYYEDGRLKAQAEYQNDSGTYREFYTSGRVRMEGWLAAGRSDSTWRYYHANGSRKASGTEKNGVREGIWQFFDTTARLVREGTYRNGVPQGRWRHFHPNGRVAAEGQKADGREEGTWNLFYDNGLRRGVLNHAVPEGNYEEYHENGKLKARGTLRNDLHEGPWEYFSEEDGTLEGRCNFLNGHGLFKGIYRDGKPRMEGYLENDRRVGRWTLYHPDGMVAGYYEAFYHKHASAPPSPAADTATVADTIQRSNLPYKKPSLRLPRKRNRHFVARPNEFRAVIVGIGPLPMFRRAGPLLPLSAEYYLHERLGYEITVALHRKPFFMGRTAISLNDAYLRGASLGIKQKFYQADRPLGIFYLAQEVRFSGLNHQATVLDDNLSRLTIRATETRYEYSVLAGDRLLADPSGQRKGRRHFTLDGFAGAGVGYRRYRPQWTNRPAWDEIFQSVPKSKLLLSLRAGLTLGYAF